MMEAEDGGSRCDGPEPVSAEWLEAETALMRRVFVIFVSRYFAARTATRSTNKQAQHGTQNYLVTCHGATHEVSLTG